MRIANRTRNVHWKEGYPVVRVAGHEVKVKDVVTQGTDNPKTSKNSTFSVLPVCTTLSPEKSAGVGNVCPHAGECAKTCLDMTGMGAMFLAVHLSRVARTVVWYKAREWFLDTQFNQLQAWERKAAKQGKRLCYRPNMLSDIPWEAHGVPQDHPTVQFYDYTKNPKRVGQVCDNYWVTFSRDSSKDDGLCVELLQEGKNVAICFDDGYTSGARNLHGDGPLEMPETWNGFPVFNGDESDMRWEDPRGVVVGLRLKAPDQAFRQKALDSGFAIPGVKA